MVLREYEKLRCNFDGVITKSFIVTKLSENPEEEAEKLFERISEFDADYYLLDTGKGTGRLHDLRVTREICRRTANIILAGGLNPVNVRGIIEFVRPFGVDVSSGVESNGRKDEGKIREFVGAVKVMK
jgi:phosphoribosylanthranilate isomerase